VKTRNTLETTPAVPAATATVRDDIQPCESENLDRFVTGLVTVLPFLALGLAGWQLWNNLLHVSDLIVLVIMYTLTTLGITVGFHRLFTHRSFQAKPWVRATLAILGSAAIEGPIISWVSDHRKHHAFSDEEGDPHSPHGHGDGVTGQLKGLWHAHLGWIFQHDQRGSHERYAPDLMRDPTIVWINSTFLVWAIGGLVMSFLLGWLIGGTLAAGLTGLLWGGAVRMFLLHHVTYSINSICHVFGNRAYDTSDHSGNVPWLAIASFGESWHNNHHAFPTSAHHGLKRRQIDLSALVIDGLARLGLAWDVKRPKDEQRPFKRPSGAPTA